MLRVVVLGAAAGGGVPQWNCGCDVCRKARGEHPELRSTQASIAISGDGKHWFLINASPDLRQQLSADPDFAPAPDTRGTPIAGIILTSADVDCVMGLLHLREFQPLHIYATASVLRAITQENTLFRALERSVPPVRWEALPLGRPVPVFQQKPASGAACLTCKAVPLGGEFPDYVSETLRRSLPPEEAVIGLELVQGDKKFFYAPSLPGPVANWKCCATASDLALLDGTFWTDNELIDVRGGGKTAREIGHVPLSGPDGLLEQLKDAGNVRRVLIHLNNTNPALDEESSASRALREAGWEVACDGMEFQL